MESNSVLFWSTKILSYLSKNDVSYIISKYSFSIKIFAVFRAIKVFKGFWHRKRRFWWFPNRGYLRKHEFWKSLAVHKYDCVARKESLEDSRDSSEDSLGFWMIRIEIMENLSKNLPRFFFDNAVYVFKRLNCAHIDMCISFYKSTVKNWKKSHIYNSLKSIE